MFMPSWVRIVLWELGLVLCNDVGDAVEDDEPRRAAMNFKISE